jgi:hypothetical protein
VKNQRKRLRTIELELTPEQIVFLWINNVLREGSYYDVWRCVPEPRTYIANAVSEAVSKSMRGSANTLVEQAIREARMKADFVYLLFLQPNTYIYNSVAPMRVSLGLLASGIRILLSQEKQDAGHLTNFGWYLRFMIEEALEFEEAVNRVRTEYFDGQNILFRETTNALEYRLYFLNQFVKSFNLLAHQACVDEIDIVKLQDSIQSAQSVLASDWVNIARLEMLCIYDRGDNARALAKEIITRDPLPIECRAHSFAATTPDGKGSPGLGWI